MTTHVGAREPQPFAVTRRAVARAVEVGEVPLVAALRRVELAVKQLGVYASHDFSPLLDENSNRMNRMPAL